MNDNQDTQNLGDIIGNVFTNEGIKSKIVIELTNKTYYNLFATITLSIITVYLLGMLYNMLIAKK